MTTGINKFYIKTLGCKVNQYESQLIRENMLKSGFLECGSMGLADTYIVNTCTVTHKADSESRHIVGLIRRANPSARIVVTGCYVEKNARDISFLPGVEHIVRNEEKHNIASILGGSPRSRLSSACQQISDFKDHVKAFVKVQDGCDNYCAYCKVPLVRGQPKSRPIKYIIEEAQSLVEGGFKEIVLTGICLGAWGEDLSPNAGLLDILKALEGLDGIFRIRLSSIEPKYVTDELINYIASNRRICRHLHIPLQSGDDDVLKRMNRPYARDEYKGLIERIRTVIPDIAITTDVLVGFPGETEENFRNTLNLVRDILPMRIHVFGYSRREGTKAARYKDVVKHENIRRRRTAMWALALETSYLYRMGFVSRELDVLVETKRDYSTGMLEGYSNNYIKVLLNGHDNLMGEMVPVKIDFMTLTTTIGKLES